VKLLEDIFEDFPEELTEEVEDGLQESPPEMVSGDPEEGETLSDDMPELIYAQSLAEHEELPPLTRRSQLRTIFIMSALAALAAVTLLIMIILCLPYFGGHDEDPEAVIHHYNQESLSTEPPRETILEPTISETEPENPTIPPDRNPYGRNDFQYNSHNYLLLQNLHSSPGVDVSAFQGKIDWKKVKNSGIEFAIVRLGYRGYESGKLVEDEYAKKNLDGAAEAGLKVGAYFFSQADRKSVV